MSNDWRGINDLYYTTGASAPHKKPVPGPGLDDDGCAAEKKQEPQVRLSDPRFIKPVGGYRPGKPCRLSVRVEPLVEKPRKRVLFDVYSSYNGRPEIREYVRLSGFIEASGDAVAEMKYLPLNEHYANDREKPPDAAYGIRFEAYHAAGGAPVSSETLRLPCPEEPLPDLRRGHYDDTGAQRYGKPREGEDYVPGEAVKALQQDLSTLRFLPKGPADGFFGDTTDAAVREFQEYAIAAFRLPLGKGKLITTDSRLAQSSPDGIVGR